jgi:recombination protein RecA
LASDKKRKLEKTLAALQDRWGAQAVRRLGRDKKSSNAHIPTGFPPLDEALIIGGLPRGRISEFIGIPTSGMATIALKIAANAQEVTSSGSGQAIGAIYIDPGQTFDPDYAARCGLKLDQLVLVRPYDTRQALDILQDFIMGGGINILIFDMPFALLTESESTQALSSTLGRLIAPLSRSYCVLLFLTSLPARKFIRNQLVSPEILLAAYPQVAGSSNPISHYAAVRLVIQRERWLYKERDIRGYQARVTVIKNKLGPASKRASIAITFNGTVKDSP